MTGRDVTARTLGTEVHGRYLIDSVWPGARRNLLVGFHGYGETAERHLEELGRLELDEWRLASVQALHPFYNQKTNQVVASWMTRLDRELAIADNIEYVAAVLRTIQAEGQAERLVFAGFSQGVAMVYRIAAFGRHRSDGLIALAGDVPPDVKADAVRLPRVLVGRGIEDDWYTEEVMTKDLEFLRTASADVQVSVFEGGHEWTEIFRDAVRAFLRRVSNA